MIMLNVNGQDKEVDADPATPILWVVREKLKMPGTKFGCGIAQCGACTVHLDGKPIRSCSTPISAAAGKALTTIEGIASEDGTLHKVQQAWIEAQVPQCGYCQSGQIMAAAALLKSNPKPTDAQIDSAMA
ncbi:MAG: (2Fe-2S)-binding protein, partial [Sphingorhabdus sp.]